MSTPKPKIIKPSPRTTNKTPAETLALQKVRSGGGKSDLKVPCSVRKNRTASCPRYSPHGPPVNLVSNSQTRTRASSTAPKPTAQTSNTSPGGRKPSSRPAKRATKCGQQGALTTTVKHSDSAFTVIPPDPKKRLEIQKKAEAEFTALEELRLSKAMTYVSIRPSAVGGCLSLEEVQQKQQQEMKQSRRKRTQIKEPIVAVTS